MGAFEFIEREAFAVAFVSALAASAAVALVALLWQRMRAPTRVLPVAGLIGVAAAVFALRRTDAVRGDEGALLWGLLALAAAGLLASVPKFPWFLRLLAMAPGAILVSDAAASAAREEISGDWVQILALVAVLVGATTVVDFDRRYANAGLGPVSLAVTSVGVYLCVPDTEQALALVGAFLAIGLLGWPKPLASLGAVGACAAVGLVVWTAAAGGRGRPGSIVGGIACIGLLLLEPTVRALLRRRSWPAPRSPWERDALAIAGVHIGVVFACSRVAGLRNSAIVAAVVVALAYVGAALLLTRLAPRPDDATRQLDGLPSRS